MPINLCRRRKRNYIYRGQTGRIHGIMDADVISRLRGCMVPRGIEPGRGTGISPEGVIGNYHSIMM